MDYKLYSAPSQSFIFMKNIEKSLKVPKQSARLSLIPALLILTYVIAVFQYFLHTSGECNRPVLIFTVITLIEMFEIFKNSFKGVLQ